MNDLDAPQQLDAGGDLGTLWTRILHYHYNCDKHFEHCEDEEQFYLANGYGIWQWEHFRNGELVKQSLMNNMRLGRAEDTLRCSEKLSLAATLH